MTRSMLTNTRTTRIEWGDCDPAGIIFYPRYFEMFDMSTTMLIERALGMKQNRLSQGLRFLGHPLVETRARFLVPTRFGDEVAIETHGRRLRPVELQDRASADASRRARGRGYRDPRLGRAAIPTIRRAMKIAADPAEVVAQLTHERAVASRGDGTKTGC